jgi:hypothetical protein
MQILHQFQDLWIFHCDEPELDATLFNDDGERNNLTLFELIAF